MKYLLFVLLGIVGLGIVTGMWLMGNYNALVSLDEAVTTERAQVETQYQRRFDLIPGLVESTKGVLRQEQAVFGAIAEARTRYAGTESGSDERVEAAGQLDSALSRLLVIMENYPQLKSDQTVQGLMDELAGTENRIAVARGRYNETVRTYNVKIKRFPVNMIAGMFGFEGREMFESVDKADEAVKVDLSL